MRKIYKKEIVNNYINKTIHGSILRTLPVEIFLLKYEEGEFANSPFDNERLFQIVVSGSLAIYFVRDDGSRYALSSGGINYILGDMDLFHQPSTSIYAEANKGLTTLAFSMDNYEQDLLESAAFLRLIAESLSVKMGVLTAFDAASASLNERVLSYMKYKCQDGILKGIEQTAFHLHCSSRHLQRIMNKFTDEGLIEKIGKGTYRLL